MARLVALFSLTLALTVSCACGGKTPPTTPTGEGTGSDTGSATPVEPVIDTAQLGQPCGEADACQPGAACVKYYGIAGPSGPEFKSCEIQCSDPKGTCPGGTKCVTVADGPGQVCRADTVAP
jgi:hypothetical protein